jgi:hypothetical protein
VPLRVIYWPVVPALKFTTAMLLEAPSSSTLHYVTVTDNLSTVASNGLSSLMSSILWIYW